MSETASFTDPVFLARFGLSRENVINYFLHPLNPFRTAQNTSNDVLAMQGITIGILMQQGSAMRGPLPPQAAEEEYQEQLRGMKGEQYELLKPSSHNLMPSPLFTLRHVYRTSPSSAKILGVYYVVEGVIYKSPAVRSLMKANVSRTSDCLASTLDGLSRCARYAPSVGYLWVFEDDDGTENPVDLLQLSKRKKRRKVVDSLRLGERSAAEEEGQRATEAMDAILVRLSKSKWVAPRPPPAAAAATSLAAVAPTNSK